MSELLTASINDALPADAGRDSKGRFAPGNQGGPGNPHAGKIANFRAAVLKCVTPEDVEGIIKRLIEMAKEGHWQAAKLILSYTLGKPQSPSPDELHAMALADVAEPAPSTNGELEVVEDAPSANGDFVAEPSANGEIEETPSANGIFVAEPSANGKIDESPSANGISEPTLNRQERRALRKARRLAKQRRNTPTPVASVN
jgi:hypothetical protein